MSQRGSGYECRRDGQICRTYAEMVDAIDARLVELNVQHLAIDEKCGLANGHTGKLLGPKPTKHYGPVSFDLHLQALGLRIVVEPDPERARPGLRTEMARAC